MTTMTEEPQLRNLNTVRVRVEELIEVVQKNRDEHRKIFEEAIEGWKEEITKQLEEAVADAKAGKKWRLNFGPSRPEDHTQEYDQVLTMLEMSQDEELELSAAEFGQYVMDRWGWQRAFLMSTSPSSETASQKANRVYGEDFS